MTSYRGVMLEDGMASGRLGIRVQFQHYPQVLQRILLQYFAVDLLAIMRRKSHIDVAFSTNKQFWKNYCIVQNFHWHSGFRNTDLKWNLIMTSFDKPKHVNLNKCVKYVLRRPKCSLDLLTLQNPSQVCVGHFVHWKAETKKGAMKTSVMHSNGDLAGTCCSNSELRLFSHRFKNTDHEVKAHHCNKAEHLEVYLCYSVEFNFNTHL